MDYLEFIARVTSHIPDKGQVPVRYYGLYANAHRGKVKKTSLAPASLGMMEEELRLISGAFLPVGSFPAPFRRFQPNLIRSGSLIYHPFR